MKNENLINEGKSYVNLGLAYFKKYSQELY